MERVKKTENYEVMKKRSGRYAVLGKDKKWINAQAKTEILVKEGLVKLMAAAPKKEETTQEEPAGE